MGANNITTQPVVRKFKASDLPLPSATRSAIDNLAHAFKKKGRYDAIRKQLWAKFEAKVDISSYFLSSSVCFWNFWISFYLEVKRTSERLQLINAAGLRSPAHEGVARGC